ncbi:phosphatidic acid phosphatase type 2/haloperoxidase [Mycena metata]|uniref:Phosphatidic acid phosphatase type 2/haloperoxidase n=1 Tax=Mycena metata TaxID=1033252 RepID=A0AAD7NAU2_9AGAR|nr:phosphatidic acid phosphatase type 2/haloperoxidase [Mycena metata]
MPSHIRLPDHDSETLAPTAMPAARPVPLSAAHRRKLLLSYAPDWIITIVLAAVFFSLDKVHGFRREFSVEDISLRFPFAVHERVPDFALYLIAIVAPVILQGVINLLTIRSWWDLHNGLLGLALGLSIAGSVTQFTKLTVGRPRPDILDRCQPIPGSVDPVYRLSNASICTTPLDSAIMLDGFRSFPSGHSVCPFNFLSVENIHNSFRSPSPFAGLGFLAFYLAGKLHLFDHRGYVAKAWISLVPFAGASLVAISRTMDSRHHWQDVLAGSILGTVVSYFSYRQYYPTLTSEVSHLPYAPRVGREDLNLPTHHRQTSNSYRDDHATTDSVIDSGPLEGTVARGAPSSLREVWRDSRHHEES